VFKGGVGGGGVWWGDWWGVWAGWVVWVFVEFGWVVAVGEFFVFGFGVQGQTTRKVGAREGGGGRGRGLLVWGGGLCDVGVLSWFFGCPRRARVAHTVVHGRADRDGDRPHRRAGQKKQREKLQRNRRMPP